jgi:hypothetical protein
MFFAKNSEKVILEDYKCNPPVGRQADFWGISLILARVLKVDSARCGLMQTHLVLKAKGAEKKIHRLVA